MGRRYVLSGVNLSLGTGDVLAALRPAAAGNAASIIEIERVEVSQNGSSTPAQVAIAIGSRNTSGTLTVTSSTPANLSLGGPASGLTGGTNALAAAACGVNSSADSGGSYTPVDQLCPNNLGGYTWQATPKMQELLVVPAVVFVVYFTTAPGTTTGWNVDVWFHEYY